MWASFGPLYWPCRRERLDLVLLIELHFLPKNLEGYGCMWGLERDSSREAVIICLYFLWKREKSHMTPLEPEL